MKIPDKTSFHILMSFCFLCGFALLSDTQLAAQESDNWNNLRRSTYDTSSAVLRAPCVRVVDSMGSQISGLAPAYSINLLADGNQLTLGENLLALAELPSSCLDLLTLSSDSSSATYQTSSAQLDTDAALFRDTYFTLELQGNLSVTPPRFNVVSATSRSYTRAGYQSDAVLNLATEKSRLYDNADLELVGQEVVRRLIVSEPGVYEAECRYRDIIGNVIELVDSINGNPRYRLNQNLTNADNGSVFFVAECDIYNRDLNLFETRLERIASWVLALP